MSPVLVDSNVLIDVVAVTAAWSEWSTDMVARLSQETTLVINPLIYGEVSVGLDSIEALDAALPSHLLRRAPLPYNAAFLAGKAFDRYRRSGGTRRSPLPDFYIGAHAAVLGYALLTRDVGRYRTYFPSLELIAPT